MANSESHSKIKTKDFLYRNMKNLQNYQGWRTKIQGSIIFFGYKHFL